MKPWLSITPVGDEHWRLIVEGLLADASG
jgi:hypothetical protein